MLYLTRVSATCLAALYLLVEIAPFVAAIIWSVTPPHRSAHADRTIFFFCIVVVLVVVLFFRAYTSKVTEDPIRRFELSVMTISVTISFVGKAILFLTTSSAVFASPATAVVAIPLFFAPWFLAFVAFVCAVFEQKLASISRALPFASPTLWLAAVAADVWTYNLAGAK